MAKIADFKSNIQSKIQQDINEKQKQIAASSAAAKAGSTETPTVTDTPKVAQTAKSVQSIPKVSITPVSITSTPTNTTNTTSVPDLLSAKTTPALRKAETPDLLSKQTEEKELVNNPIPWSIIASANATWGNVAETVNNAVGSQFTDWFNEITNKSEQDSQYYANKLANSWIGNFGGAVLDLGKDVLGYTSSALWYYSNKALDTIAKSLWAQDTKITEERNKYWEEKFTPEQRKQVKETIWAYWIDAMRFINDSEYYVAKLADVIETSLWGKWWFTEAFQQQQWEFWDIYWEQRDLESTAAYENDLKAQEVGNDVRDYIYDLTNSEDFADLIWGAAWHILANLRDPKLVAWMLWYMTPALILQSATWWWFWGNTLIWAPSQSASVYKDYSQDPDIVAKNSDNAIFWESTAVWIVLSMVESFWDALWDMPWAKAMSRDIRKMFTKSLRKNVTKWLTKEIEEAIDKNVIDSLKKPVLNAISKWFRWGFWEWVEEVTQESLQTESARLLGSKREHLTLQQLLTIWWTARWVGGITQWVWTVINIKQNQDLRKEYDNFSKALDEIAPWINEETKQAFFSAMITSQQNDASLSEKRVEKYETQVTELYNQISELEQQQETTTDENTKKEISTKIEWLNNQITEIDKKINQWRRTEEEINKYIEEYNAKMEEEELENLNNEINKEQQLPKEVGWENLSEQTMWSIDQWEVSQGTWNPSESKQSFDKSIQQITNWTEYWNTDFAKNYAYATSWKYMLWDTKQNQKLINKVQSLLSWVGIKIRFGDNLQWWTRWLYDSWIVYYKKWNKELTLYWHEVFHAMMDVINNGKLDDAQMQTELQDILNQAIEEVKKQFWIDGYKSWKELEYANKFAEEWLANSFWEYLANREINWPKTFVQKIIDFFNQILDLFRWNKKISLNKELKKAFDKIASWEVTGRRWIPTMVSMPSASPIESSTDITQDAMRDVNEEWYENLVKENQQQTEQQQELWEHYEDILEAWKESENDNNIEEISNEAEIIKDVQWVQTTPQTIRDAFWKDLKKQKKAFSLMKTEAWQAFRDMFSPAISRIYNISPRVAWRLVQMEWKRDINVARYRDRAKPFVEAVSKLSAKDKLEVKKALLDYWALASEQENIEQYKKDEVAKLKETLNKYGITDDMFNEVVWVLTELWQKYKDAWLSITLTDMYFPRTVTDYEGLSQYIAEKTWVEWKERETLLNRIAKIRRNEQLTEEEKEKSIRRLLTVDYHEPWTTSKYWKERKLWKLSDWWEWIYQFYADPMESLDSYIVNMENAIQRQLFLWWLQEDAGLKWENVSFTEIVEWLVDEGKISNDDLEELKKTVLAVLNKKPSPKIVRTLKDATYIMTLTNFLSAINQLDDLWMAIIKNKNWLKHVVKAIFWKANIKYTDLWLEDSYEMFRGQGKITNRLFQKSFFSTFDRLGKTSFVNAAWDSLIAQAKKNKDWTDTRSRINLRNRLVEMYWEETAEHMMEKIDSGNYMTNWQIDIDILVDLLYQLWSTQPIFTSAMPTVYLNNPWIRLCYALQSFTIKRIDLLVQWTKQVYKNNGWWAGWAVVAWAWLMWVSAFLAMFWVAIWDLQDWLKDEEEETALWKLLNEGIDEALKEVWNEWKSSWLKIWNLSLYDKKTYNREWLWWLIMSKVKPPMIWIWKNFVDAITEHNADEATDLIQYIPIIWKLLYYRYFDDIAEATGKSDDWYIWREDSFSWRDDDNFTWRDDKWFTWRE